MKSADSLDGPDYRLRMKFSVLGSDRDYTEINGILGVDAKHYARKGASVEGRPIAKQNVWSYWGDESDEEAELNSQWISIHQLIVKERRNIIELKDNAKLEVAIIAYSFREFPPMYISPEIVKEIASIGACLDIYLTGSLTGEVF